MQNFMTYTSHQILFGRSNRGERDGQSMWHILDTRKICTSFCCFFLICKANASIKLAKTGHGPHSFKLVVICVVNLLFVLFCVLFVCKCLLPPGDNPIAVNKYIISCHFVSYHNPWGKRTLGTPVSRRNGLYSGCQRLRMGYGVVQSEILVFFLDITFRRSIVFLRIRTGGSHVWIG
jgi:hypothetical protein